MERSMGRPIISLFEGLVLMLAVALLTVGGLLARAKRHLALVMLDMQPGQRVETTLEQQHPVSKAVLDAVGYLDDPPPEMHADEHKMYAFKRARNLSLAATGALAGGAVLLLYIGTARLIKEMKRRE